MSMDFYRAFEDKHRGSRELIKSRLRVYLPFVELLKLLNADCRAIDLGCGRGEWLELLRDAGVAAHGVDLDEGMLASCSESGLSAEACEAVSYIKGQPDESHDIVSGFHLAEHLPFDELQTLVREAMRVLRPAGLLILETPNPENIAVGTTNFYLDPTHQRPIPPRLLAFLPEHYGFCRTKIMRLQESRELARNPAPNLLNVLNGASPDFAVVAQKGATSNLLDRFDAVFAQEYGLSIEELAMRYESNIQQNFSGAIQLASRVAEQAENSAQRAEARTQQVQQRLAEREEELNKAQQRLAEREEALAQTQQRLIEFKGELASVYQCNSWKLTRPLRIIKKQLREWVAVSVNLLLQLSGLPKRVARPVLLFLFNHIQSHPQRKRQVARYLSYFPKLDARLRAFARRSKLGGGLLIEPIPCSEKSYTDKLSQCDSGLSESAERVLRDLENAFKR